MFGDFQDLFLPFRAVSIGCGQNEFREVCHVASHYSGAVEGR